MTQIAGQQFNPLQGSPSDVPPLNPFDGQLWYNPADNILHIYDATKGAFKDISGPSDADFFLDDGLEAHWKMDDGVSSTLIDATGNTHDVDRFGPFDAASTAGVLNLAQQFVGNAAQYYANATDLGAVGQYTVAGHFRMDGVGAGPLFMSGWTAGAIKKVWELRNDSIEFFDSAGASLGNVLFNSDLLDETVWKTVVVSVDYDGRWQVLKNGFSFASGVAPTSVTGQPVGQIRVGEGLAFTVDSLSFYNDRAHTEAFAVTYHNSGSGILYTDYPITNINRVPLGILAEGVDTNNTNIVALQDSVLYETAGGDIQAALDGSLNPSATNVYLTAEQAGMVSATQNINIARFTASTGVQIIAHSLGVEPRLFAAHAVDVTTSFIGQGNAYSDGATVAQTGNCQDQNKPKYTAEDACFVWSADDANYTFRGKIQNITTTTFEVNWSSSGVNGEADASITWIVAIAG